ncbi:hypothetical protein R1flu_028957 [Riccia fluitans]|uniref:Uncharacterized protein n=1 Tax=Riccia fluitans TaxID=41844 RepID=A0ABD1XN81_9MARC
MWHSVLIISLPLYRTLVRTVPSSPFLFLMLPHQDHRLRQAPVIKWPSGQQQLLHADLNSFWIIRVFTEEKDAYPKLMIRGSNCSFRSDAPSAEVDMTE